MIQIVHRRTSNTDWLWLKKLYLVHSLKGIVVSLDSCLVEIVAIGFHMEAFLAVVSHLVQLLAVVADTYAVKVELDSLLVDFCNWISNQIY